MTRRPSIPVRFLRYFVGFKLTPFGRIVAAVMILTALGSMTVEIAVYQLFCGLLMLFAIAEAVGNLFRPRFEVSGSLPPKMTVGESARGLVTLRNRGWFPAFDVMVGLFALPGSLRHTDGNRFVTQIPSGGEAHLPVTLTGTRRGIFALPPVIAHSTFPLNLMRFGNNRLDPTTLTVLPAFHRLEDLELAVSQRYQPGGVAVESRRGQSTEFVGNREYVYGEPIRRLDFRAWARLGKPVIREFQEEYCSRVALVLDTYRPPGWFSKGSNAEQFEAAVSLTASIADILNENSHLIDVFAAGPELYIFQTSSGATHLESVLEILASVDQTRRNPFEKLSPVIVDSLESISSVLCVMLDWDEPRTVLTQRVLEAGCSLRVFVVRERPTTAPLPDEGETYTQLSPAQVLEGEVRKL